ncbi:ATP-binding protein [Nonomuraea wenchangensis]|uniref:Histidine kinase-, DNA gyrase B-, and HSP90-like ATPase n=1 Tax=Nonomuraea wenchangensis TaxID=568860 RepID=A0A1I0FJM1_9ACTN|nr:ATP-binding protein [Nonomuraea wenchangensis]SET57442.1 Histidine kinase-, DNA gyrase B-, and HSP90-like ATPase [Nonomuraea wenchangensis]
MTIASEPAPEHGTQFKGEITVGSRIIDDLSSGLYKSPAACLKELINNSYDADATIVRVMVKPDADRIIIEDDGEGMTQSQFVSHFSRISESHKRDDSEYTASGRPKIGKIGIGFIAANELCEEMEIYSTTRGSTELLHVTIDFEMMRLPPEQRRRGGESAYAKGDYYGEVLQTAQEDHYTKIFLKRVRGEARNILVGAGSPTSPIRESSLYGLKAETVTARLASLNSWSSLDGYSQTMLGVALNVPVPYAPAWIPDEHRPSLAEFEEQAKALAFQVEYDGTPLLKPIALRGGDESESIVRIVELDGDHVGAQGWIYAQRGVLRPEDLNGVLIRIRNAAVGEYSKNFLDFPHAEGTLFQRWISAEIYADDRLEDALNIDRRTLRDTHPAYVELRKWFHKELSDFIREVRRELYVKPSEQRQKERNTAEVTRIKAAASRVKDTLGADVARKIEDAFPVTPPAAPADSGTTRARRSTKAAAHSVNRKYSVSEVYEIVLEVANETLSKEAAQKFIEELTKRLRG